MKTAIAALMLSALCALGATNTCSVTLAWDQSPDSSVTGYNIYWGVASRSYTNHNSVGGITNTLTTITNLLKTVPYYFAATCTNSLGLESDYSVEVVWAYSPPAPPNNLMIIKVMVETAAAAAGPWTNDAEFALVRTNAPSGDGAFYRAVMGITTAKSD